MTRASTRGARWRGHGAGFVVASWLAVVAVCGFIFWMSSRTGKDIDSGNDLIAVLRRLLVNVTTAFFGHHVDVSPIGHFCEFLMLGALLANAMSLHVSFPPAGAMAAALASAWGASDEFHQLFVPERSCDPADWLVDTVAAIIGVLIVLLVLRSREKGGREDPSR